MINKLPHPYKQICSQIKSLEKYEEYLGAFIFGSLARSEVVPKSDVDVKVIVKNQKTCNAINHPKKFGKKLDITFETFRQLENFTKEEIKKRKRIPMIAESVILFDKTGKIKKLKTRAQKVKPKVLTKNDVLNIQFMIYHATDKAKRNLKDDPSAALLAMSININDIIHYHYQINRKWWRSNKFLLQNLRTWDPNLAKKIEEFLCLTDARQKFKMWNQICKYIAKPIGGIKIISEINCGCKICKKHLRIF